MLQSRRSISSILLEDGQAVMGLKQIGIRLKPPFIETSSRREVAIDQIGRTDPRVPDGRLAA